MADISLFQAPNGDKFNIKDTTARTAASQAQNTADSKISSSLKGVANGVAELDANGLVPSSQLPSFVDDVKEYTSKSAFPSTGETGKIYVAIDTNLTYRWSGSAYVEISPSLALGETSSTAYRGDRGATAYTHATDSNRLTTATASGLYKIASTSQGHISSLTAVTKTDITGLGIPGSDTDRYVNSAAFADATSTDANNPVKMTLTRAGSDTATVIGYIPKVSSSSAGVAPKGTTVSSQSQSTKFLREDGTWAKPSYTVNTNTTYTIGTSGNNVTLTPSSGSVQSITVPFATNTTNATKATQDASGDVITTTYRKLSNNDFDTVNATEVNAGDLIVTGVGRFTNGLYGDLSGTATKVSNSLKIQLNSGTTEGTNQFTYDGSAAKTVNITKSAIGLGNVDNTADANKNVASANTAGSATKATQDESGNNIKATYAASFSISDHTITLKNKNGVSLGTVTVPDNATDNTKLPLAGGTMTGTPKFAANSISEFSGNVPFILGIEAFADGGAVKWKSSSSVTVGFATNANQLTKASTLDTTDKLNAFTGTALRYASVNSGIVTSTDGLVMTIPWNDNYGQQIFFNDDSYLMKHRYHNNGTWSEWKNLVDESNINDYAPTKTGTGASGTWGISISGNAATATTANHVSLVANNEIRLAGKPSTAQTIFMGYKWSDNTSAALINRWKFCNGNGVAAEVEASTFYGALSGNATSATTASKLGSSNVGSATQPIYLSAGTATACTYTLGKSVPSDAVFTDQKVSQSETTTSDWRKIVLSYQNNSSAGTAADTYINVVYVTPKAEIQPSTGTIRSDGDIVGRILGVSQTSGTTGGISLYGGAGQVDNYGIAFRYTSNKEKHGYVQGDWATYFTMNSGATTRGWVFRTNTTNGNVASISGGGNAVFNGSVTVGGNTTNTSGVRQVYNETTKSLDFVFVA